MTREDAVAAVQAAPLDPAAHAALGGILGAAGEHCAAAACHRSALALGADGGETRLALAAALVRLGRHGDALSWLAELPADQSEVVTLRRLADGGREVPLAALDHNRHYRLDCLRSELLRLAGRDDFSVLDIGGGDGALALFLPRAAYQLVEPGTNGLTAADLPHGEDSVDVVCACHVLEHVPPAGREAFLDGLCAVARHHVLLLNPFAVAGGRHEERLRITVDLIGAPWAREHLECGLPALAEVEDYAARRGLPCRTWPNGATGTSFLMTYVGHYARLAGRGSELARINAYFNSLPPELLVSPGLPSAWFVHLDLSGADAAPEAREGLMELATTRPDA